eukprot:4194976-Amphidinium_carterae.4
MKGTLFGHHGPARHPKTALSGAYIVDCRKEYMYLTRKHALLNTSHLLLHSSSFSVRKDCTLQSQHYVTFTWLPAQAEERTNSCLVDLLLGGFDPISWYSDTIAKIIKGVLPVKREARIDGA